MNPEIIAARLWHHAAHHAALRGFAFGEGVQQQLPQLARAMAQKVLARHAAESVPLEGLIRLAEGNLSVFVDRMITAGEATPGYFAERGAVIGEITFGSALNALCPLWPICD